MAARQHDRKRQNPRKRATGTPETWNAYPGSAPSGRRRDDLTRAGRRQVNAAFGGSQRRGRTLRNGMANSTWTSRDPHGGPQFPRWAYILAGALLAFAVILTVVNCVTSCSGDATQAPAESSDSASEPASESTAAEPATLPGTRVSFVAVGDNVPNDVIAEYADACAGSEGDGAYDYKPLFAQVKPLVEAADLAYIDQEVHIGGDEIGPSGYPSFNTTDEMADAVVDCGFDLVASATNHAYDWGSFGAIEHSREVWNGQPVAFTGTATSDEEAAQIPVVERNGIRFALINYTYGINGYAPGDIPSYAVNLIDEDRIAADVERAREQADVVVAAMHWGTENETEPDAQERQWAQMMADLGVDIVLGSHPHVTQPLTWLDGKDGNRTLMAYSLGNFIIQHADPTPYNDLEGMLACDFVKYAEGEQAPANAGEHDAASGWTNAAGITIENVRWIPLVYHGVQGELAVWPLSDYSAEQAARNPAYANTADPLTWLRENAASIVNAEGNDFRVETGE